MLNGEFTIYEELSLGYCYQLVHTKWWIHCLAAFETLSIGGAKLVIVTI
jgi:hypothetical protein